MANLHGMMKITSIKNIADESISSKEYDEWLYDCGLKQ